jgi:hypothetical protein
MQYVAGVVDGVVGSGREDARWVSSWHRHDVYRRSVPRPVGSRARVFRRWMVKGADDMARVVMQAVVSVDGYIAYPDDAVGPLFDWYGNGDVTVHANDTWSFNVGGVGALSAARFDQTQLDEAVGEHLECHCLQPVGDQPGAELGEHRVVEARVG